MPRRMFLSSRDKRQHAEQTCRCHQFETSDASESGKLLLSVDTDRPLPDSSGELVARLDNSDVSLPVLSRQLLRCELHVVRLVALSFRLPHEQHDHQVNVLCKIKRNVPRFVSFQLNAFCTRLWCFFLREQTCGVFLSSRRLDR